MEPNKHDSIIFNVLCFTAGMLVCFMILNFIDYNESDILSKDHKIDSLQRSNIKLEYITDSLINRKDQEKKKDTIITTKIVYLKSKKNEAVSVVDTFTQPELSNGFAKIITSCY